MATAIINIRVSTLYKKHMTEKLVSNTEQLEKAGRVILGDDSSLNSNQQKRP